MNWPVAHSEIGPNLLKTIGREVANFSEWRGSFQPKQPVLQTVA
jgi:hypothetical protein